MRGFKKILCDRLVVWRVVLSSHFNFISFHLHFISRFLSGSFGKQRSMASFDEAPPGNSKNGEKIFKIKCAQCHAVEKSGGHKQGIVFASSLFLLISTQIYRSTVTFSSLFASLSTLHAPRIWILAIRAFFIFHCLGFRVPVLISTQTFYCMFGFRLEEFKYTLTLKATSFLWLEFANYSIKSEAYLMCDWFFET